MGETDVPSHFRLWLRTGNSGCEYAKRLAAKASQIAIVAHMEPMLPPTAWLDGVFDANADEERAVIAVFPHIQSERALIDLLNSLAGERWKILPRKKSSPSGNTCIGVDWTTKHGDVSETMGFAPFPSMPVTRRAPYVGIAAWPGQRSNPFRGESPTPMGREGRVSFLDAPHGLNERREEYEAWWQTTSERVASLMKVPPDDARLYRTTAFVISPEAAAALSSAS